MGKDKTALWREKYFELTHTSAALRGEIQELKNQVKREEYKVYSKDEFIKVLKSHVEFQLKHINEWKDQDFINSCHSQ